MRIAQHLLLTLLAVDPRRRRSTPEAAFLDRIKREILDPQKNKDAKEEDFFLNDVRKMQSISKKKASNAKMDKQLLMSPPPLPTEYVSCAVCLSPACCADGARESMEVLKALAPPHVILVEEGRCSSQCGKGPVVEVTKTTLEGVDGEKKASTTTTIHTRISASKVLDLVVTEDDENMSTSSDEDSIENKDPKESSAGMSSSSKRYQRPSKALLEGYELVQEADALFFKKKYAEALELYRKAVELSFSEALEWQLAREYIQKHAPAPTTGKASSSSSPASFMTARPISLGWLIRARRHEALCLLELRQIEGAFLAAHASCNLSRNTDPTSVQVLAKCYRAKNDIGGEWYTLKTLFDLPEMSPSMMSATPSTTSAAAAREAFAAQNERRLLFLRFSKLEREMELLAEKENKSKEEAAAEAAAAAADAAASAGSEDEALTAFSDEV